MERGLSLVSLCVLQSWGVEHPGAHALSHLPSCFAGCPCVQQKSHRHQQQPPCPFSLEEQVSLWTWEGESCSGMALHALIPLPPAAAARSLIPHPRSAPGQDAQPLQEAGGLDAESQAQVLLFLDLGCHRFSSCDQEGPIKSISSKKNGFLSEALQWLQSSLLRKGWWWSNFLETHLLLDANERGAQPLQSSWPCSRLPCSWHSLSVPCSLHSWMFQEYTDEISIGSSVPACQSSQLACASHWSWSVCLCRSQKNPSE